MRETNDGFVIAEKDLELRGPGEVLGTRQTGHSSRCHQE
jgi:ATP-dependent DNA helicase RecG